jgi:hypothetical protein
MRLALQGICEFFGKDFSAEAFRPTLGASSI